MNLICDTNIWYNIAMNVVNPDKIVEKGYDFTINPINILEIYSTEKINIDLKVKIINSMMKYGREYIKVLPDEYLINLWNVDNKLQLFDWESFLNNYKTELIHQKDNNLDIRSWKNKNYNSFSEDVTLIIERFLPEFEEKRKQGKAIHMKKNELKKIIDNEMPYMIFESFISTFIKSRGEVLSEQEYIHICSNFYSKYQEYCKKGVCNVHGFLEFMFPNDKIIRENYESIKVYCNAYPYYISEILSNTQNEPNDLGDFEMLVYVNKNNKLFTKEKKWNRILKNAKLEEYLFYE